MVAMRDDEWIARIVVRVAEATGQSVRVVAQEAFALVLWTWGIGQTLQRERSVERLGERTDLAGLVAVAFHQPGDLRKAEMRYWRAANRLSSMMDAAKQRALDTMRLLEPHANMHEEG